MPKSKRRTKKRNRPSGAGGSDGGNNPKGTWQIPPKANKMFEAFYKGLGLIPEEEWEAFMESLRTPLPVTFRVTGFRGQSKELLKIIKGEYLNDLLNSGEDEAATVVPTCLKWYPEELAWQINFSRKEVRRYPRLQKLKNFMVFETESGHLSRQEAVSMIPPLLLDIKPHHKVLDMCAAPGSKTSQLIEFLHTTENNTEPEGIVVANDVDNRRCYLMVHQVKRLQSACCVIINHDATLLPNFKTGDGPNDVVKFDRVLCDVPCSGDGTLRKNFDIWHKWNCRQANNLHKQQIKILKRGLEVLDVGGKLVYSTCSMNPIEDEAVINSMLVDCKGSVELVDVSQSLPGLKYVPGMLSWRLMATNGQWFDTFEQLRQDESLCKSANLTPTMFAPALTNAQERHLDRCVRVLPHQQDTGGFFIALLRKTAELPWTKASTNKDNTSTDCSEIKESPEKSKCDTESKDKATDDAPQTADKVTEDTQKTEDKSINPSDDQKITESQSKEGAVKNSSGNNETEGQTTDSNKRKLEEDRSQSQDYHKKMKGYKEDPFLFLKDDDPLWPSIKQFYGIGDDFCVGQLLGRTEQGKRRALYYVSPAIKTLVEKNVNRVRFINTGVRAFGRSPSPLVPDCDFRISQEGLTSLSSVITTRTVTLNKKNMTTLMCQDNPFFSKFTDEVVEQFKRLTPGSTIFKYVPVEGEGGPSCEITVCGWRGKTSVRSFVSKHERTHYLRFFGLELEDFLKEQEEERRSKKEREEHLSIMNADSDVECDDKEDETDVKKDSDPIDVDDVSESEDVNSDDIVEKIDDTTT